MPVTPPVEVEEPVVQKDVEKKDKMRMRDRSANWKSGYVCAITRIPKASDKIILFYMDGLTKPMACFQDGLMFAP